MQRKFLVLSEAALKSDWVEYELDRAREKEKDEGRDVLCPVAIDDAWEDPEKVKSISPPLWNELLKKHIIRFPIGGFDGAYKKLWSGIQDNYVGKAAEKA